MTIHVIDLALDSHEPVLYKEIDEMLTEGYVIISSVVFDDCKVPTQRLMLRKDDNAVAAKAVEPVNTQVRAIVSIECRKTYSKSAQQTFKFWTCILDNGEKVNIFDHPDESRNTFKICERRGWVYLHDLHEGDNWTFEAPVPVTVSHDGEWYSLVDIIHRDLWLDLKFEVADNEPQDMTPNDIPFDSETSDAIDNLKSGLDLDDDDSEGDSNEADS